MEQTQPDIANAKTFQSQCIYLISMYLYKALMHLMNIVALFSFKFSSLIFFQKCNLNHGLNIQQNLCSLLAGLRDK